jgi:hypothetical protein
MIEVNLLPVEMRPNIGTPLPRLMAMIIGVVVVCLEAVLILLIFMKEIPAEKRQLKTFNDSLKILDEKVTKMTAIEVENNAKQAQLDIVHGLMKERKRWTRLLVRLAERRPKRVWVTRMEYASSTSSKKPSMLRLSCLVHSDSDDPGLQSHQMVEAANEFERDIQTDLSQGGQYGLRVDVDYVTSSGLHFQKPVYPRPKKDEPELDMSIMPKGPVGRFTLSLVMKQPEAPQ